MAETFTTREEAAQAAQVFAQTGGHVLKPFTEYKEVADPRYPAWVGGCSQCGDLAVLNGVIDPDSGDNCWWFVMMPGVCDKGARRAIPETGLGGW